MKTGNSTRDREMLDWADAQTHPEGVFTLTELVSQGAETLARGRLAMNGQENPVEFPVRMTFEDSGLAASGEFQLDFRRWGLPPIRRFVFVTVDPVVTVRFLFSSAIAPASGQQPVSFRDR